MARIDWLEPLRSDSRACGRQRGGADAQNAVRVVELGVRSKFPETVKKRRPPKRV